jgi:hypothetical protein
MAADRGRADAAHLFLQQWFNLSDPAVEEALYDSAAMRRFVGIRGRWRRECAQGDVVVLRSMPRARKDHPRCAARQGLADSALARLSRLAYPFRGGPGDLAAGRAGAKRS